MSKLNEARLASLADKIYDGEAEQELKRERKPRKKLKLKLRGSSRTTRIKKSKKK